MKRRLGVLLIVPILFALSACAPATHSAQRGAAPATKVPVIHKSSSPTPTPSATTSAPKIAAPVNAADYLLDGTPNVPDANGDWFGDWGFFTDSTKTVWCEFEVFSGDNPGASCSIVPSAHALATYAKPAGTSADCTTSAYDGYTLAIGGAADDLQPTADAGWDQCVGLDPQTAGYISKSKVLPDGATISFAPISCTVTSGVATCGETPDGQPTFSITLGLHTASFHSTS